jgi:hypothetical protein
MFTMASAGRCCAAAADLCTLEAGENTIGTRLMALGRHKTRASADAAPTIV